jgi:predicted HicB family RNase H-like nuclease
MPTNLIKTMVYMPPELRAALERMAKRENRSLSNLIVTLLQQVVEEQEGKEISDPE